MKSLFAVLVSALVGALSIGIAANVLNAVASAKGMRGCVNRAKAAVRDKFPMKMDVFVNLNGGVTRLVGRSICNKRLMYGRDMLGMLCYAEAEEAGMRRGRESVESLAAGLRRREVPFVFALAPCKLDLEDELVPPGWYVWNANVAAERTLAELRSRDVRVLDLIPHFAATADDVEDAFFRTDHHWKIRAAFKATRLVAAEIADILKMPEIADHPNLDENRWEWRILRDGFCGAHGRRTGRVFAGMEDFEYAVPRFPTDIEFSVPHRKVIRTGSFEDAELERRFLDDTGWHVDRYAAYTGGNAPMQLHSSASAPFPYRVLVFKDSFGNPVASFLSTMFKEVVQVDMRRQPEALSELDIVDRFKPDVVVRIENITSFVKAGYKLK